MKNIFNLEGFITTYKILSTRRGKPFVVANLKVGKNEIPVTCFDMDGCKCIKNNQGAIMKFSGFISTRKVNDNDVPSLIVSGGVPV
ncbi:hypothetical protein JCM15457_2539 [Liquorilactobacillus sucicola DSM 21376 = JCM 15457]|uniref:hypothetical protein n=1 Tax=Liquorilactobacillus sucicola TaxID=519050 RepID=UPI000432580E|nr:hypothetical protein [Liquorilactobacillus sucicola]GAJ27537.1 hypothetical protein JCM15457_2539 [Liquorilactobacillus sucicola DSM 21376 = JCM 15457]